MVTMFCNVCQSSNSSNFKKLYGTQAHALLYFKNKKDSPIVFGSGYVPVKVKLLVSYMGSFQPLELGIGRHIS